MTKEEAINILTCGLAEVEWAYPMEYAAALDVAIETLEKEKETAKWKMRVVGGFDQHIKYICPICSITIADQSFKLNYCPHCGTKMVGKEF